MRSTAAARGAVELLRRLASLVLFEEVDHHMDSSTRKSVRSESKKVDDAVIAVMMNEKQKQKLNAHSAGAPTQMLKVLAAIEAHYKNALAEKIAEVIRLGESEEALSGMLVTTQAEKVGLGTRVEAAEGRCRELELRLLDVEHERAKQQVRIRSLERSKRETDGRQDELLDLRRRLATAKDEVHGVQAAADAARADLEKQVGDLRCELADSHTEIARAKAANDELASLRYTVQEQVSLSAKLDDDKRNLLSRIDALVEDRDSAIAMDEELRMQLEHGQRDLAQQQQDSVDAQAEIRHHLSVVTSAVEQHRSALVRSGGGFVSLGQFMQKICTAEEKRRYAAAETDERTRRLDAELADIRERKEREQRRNGSDSGVATSPAGSTMTSLGGGSVDAAANQWHPFPQLFREPQTLQAGFGTNHSVQRKRPVAHGSFGAHGGDALLAHSLASLGQLSGGGGGGGGGGGLRSAAPVAPSRSLPALNQPNPYTPAPFSRTQSRESRIVQSSTSSKFQRPKSAGTWAKNVPGLFVPPATAAVELEGEKEA